MAQDISKAKSDWLVGSGEMFERIRDKDWSDTPVGPREQWPSSLRNALNLLLGNRYPMFVWWGPELINFYNDAYIPALGSRHPDALGRPASKIWFEIWEEIGRQCALVFQGESTWNERVLLILQRYGFDEETYFTFSYSPLRDDDGSVAGVFSAVTEETERVLGERRLSTLRVLAADTASANSAQQACDTAIQSLMKNYDLPFAAIYLSSDDKDKIRKLCTTQSLNLPEEINVNENLDDKKTLSPLCRIFKNGGRELISDFAERFGAHTGAIWPEPITTAVVLPITQPTQKEPLGIFVAGLSPRLPLNEQYEGFLNLVAGQISNAVADAEAIEEERKRAEALAELDAAKTIFFSNISHEFRTPLTLMLGPLEDAFIHQISPKNDELDLIYRNALRLLKMVNALLDFSRIEAGRMKTAFEPTDLATFTSDLASVFRSAVERAGLRFNINCPKLSRPVSVDREMWEQIVLNLISNAFKFTFEGEINVSLKEKDDYVVLTIGDTGIGISAEEIPNIFERFHRIEGARGRSVEGSGIGLALINELVKLHEGSIGVESFPGKGTTFHISIPFQDKQLSRSITYPESYSVSSKSQTFIEEAVRWLPDDQQTSSLPHISMPGSVESKAINKSRILIADDNSDMRNYLRNLLGTQYEVEAVADGNAAVDAIKENPPDLLITDIMMPQMDGFELLHQLRSNPHTQSLPIIVLSARAGEESRIEGIQAGADDYVVKPFSARELLARISARLEISEMRRQAEEARLKGMQQISQVTDAAPVYIANYDLNRRYKMVNKRYADRFGLKPEEVIGKYIWEVTGKESYERIKEYLDRVSLGEPVRFEFELEDKDLGNRFWYGSYAPEFAESGEIIGILGAFTDVTEHRRQEKNQIFFLEISNKIREVSDAQGLFQVVPRMVGEHLNASRCFINEINLRDATATIYYDYSNSHLPSLVGTVDLVNYSQIARADIMAGKTVVNCDTHHDPRTKDFYETSYGPDAIGAYIAVPLMRDKQWVATFWVSSESMRLWKDWEIELIETVAEKTWLAVEKLRSESKVRLQEAALIESGNRFRALVEASTQIVWMVEPPGDVLEDSPSWRKFTGQSYDEFKGLGMLNAIHPEDREKYVKQWRMAFEKQSAFTMVFRLRDSNGEWRWMGSNSVALFSSDKTLQGWMAMASDITLRKMAEQEREGLLLQEQTLRMELEKSNRVKDEFLATVSHELRTPLNAILGWSHILRSSQMQSDENQVAVDSIYLSATNQAQIIDDLLDVSRIINGKMTIRPQSAKISEIISSAITTFNHAIHVKNIELNVQYDGEVETLTVFADPQRLQQIFWNLLSNAVKFTPPGGKIEVRVSQSGSELNIVIQDSGAGIDQEFLPHVFERFRQADSSTTRKIGGLGLGLSIVKHLVELHGGNVKAESQGEGLGAKFTVTLPLRPENVSPSVIWIDQKGNLQEKSMVDSALSGVRILTIDDDSSTLKLLNAIFSKVDAKITSCSSAREGLLALKESLPDVVICDIAMPNEDGYWFIEKVRSSSGSESKVPAIALTAYASATDRERVLASGFQTFVPKPVEPAELLHSVMRILASQNKTISIAAQAVRGDFSLASKKILLVEDDLISAEMFRIAFENAESDFRAVSRSSDALKILEEWIPDIIVSDLGLPDEDGYSLIKKIRSNPSADRARIPAIALTGYGKEEGARAIDSGFQLYRTKPIQPDTLIALVINLLRNS